MRLAAVLALLLISCGGGGSSPANPASHRTDLLYGYFGSADNPASIWNAPAPGQPDSVAETAGHSNLIMTGGWCDWATVDGRAQCADRARRHITEARALGIRHFVVTVDFLIWQPDGSERPGGVGDVQALLLSLGDLSDIDAIYPIDEPNTRIGGGADLRSTFLALRSMLQGLPETRHIALFAIYAPLHYGTLNMDLFDWIGVDDYGVGEGVLDEYASVPAGKRLVLVPGGAAPWLEDPQPFRDFADANPAVVAIVPFLWLDAAFGAGIRDAPSHAEYVALGCAIKGCV